MLKFWKFRIRIYGISPLRLLRDENQLVLYWFIKSYDVPLLSLHIYTYLLFRHKRPFLHYRRVRHFVYEVFLVESGSSVLVYLRAMIP